MIWLWYGLSLLIIILDQWTKQLAESRLTWGESVQVTSWFDFTLAYNTGAAFSFLSDAGGWQRWFFAIVALGVSAFIAVWMWRLPKEQRLLGFGLALILGGAIGNLYDRLALGHVIDFISVHYQSYYWPAFNIADSAICVGAAFLIIDMFKNPQKGASHGE